MDSKPLGNEKRWANKASHSVFFLGAVLFHLLLLLAVATCVVFTPSQPPQEVTVIPPLPPKPTSTVTPPITPLMPKVDMNASVGAKPIINNGPSQPFSNFKQTPIDFGQIDDHAGSVINTPAPKNPEDDLSRKESLNHLVHDKWGVDPTDQDTHNPKAKFVVYVAAYADGDWACNTMLDNGGNITAGAIPDLLEKIKEWTHGRTQGEIVSTPLQIGSPDLLEKMPPFIFFTGHKDFVLTDAEIENLRNYLQDGGAIWGDNALPGEGSRFDVAFHREMKRVIPDKDKNFEPLPLTHDIFTRREFLLAGIPKGMNYYAEPIQHIDIGGKLAILYTPNDYSDILFLRILPGDKAADLAEPPKTPLHTNMGMWARHEVFYRNFSLESSLAAHRLGMNVVTYLLTRFNDQLATH